MDTAEEAVDYNTMDHSQVNRVFVDDLLVAPRSHASPADGNANTRDESSTWEPARRSFPSSSADVPVVGTSPRPIWPGRCSTSPPQNIVGEASASGSRCNCLDAKRLPFGDGQFDVVMSNSILHHIPDPARRAWPRWSASLRPADCCSSAICCDRTAGRTRSSGRLYAGDANAHQQSRCSASRCTPR